MEITTISSILVIPNEEWKRLLENQQQILDQLLTLQSYKAATRPISPYITAKEFMVAVRICWSNFDKLVNVNKIMMPKKGRKVYVVDSEIERYFREVEV